MKEVMMPDIEETLTEVVKLSAQATTIVMEIAFFRTLEMISMDMMHKGHHTDEETRSLI